MNGSGVCYVYPLNTYPSQAPAFNKTIFLLRLPNRNPIILLVGFCVGWGHVRGLFVYGCGPSHRNFNSLPSGCWRWRHFRLSYSVSRIEPVFSCRVLCAWLPRNINLNCFQSIQRGWIRGGSKGTAIGFQIPFFGTLWGFLEASEGDFRGLQRVPGVSRVMLYFDV